MNPLYNMMMGSSMAPIAASPSPSPVPQMAPMAQQLMNRIGQTGSLLQAMQNPAAFVKQQFPDIPDQIANDPNQILGYLQRTRGISNQQIQQAANMMPYITGR